MMSSASVRLARSRAGDGGNVSIDDTIARALAGFERDQDGLADGEVVVQARRLGSRGRGRRRWRR